MKLPFTLTRQAWPARVLRFSALPTHELAAACALGLVSVLWFEVVKWARRASEGARRV